MKIFHILQLLLIIVVILTSGCTSSLDVASSSGQSQISPTATTNPASIQQLASTTNVQQENKYVIGDIIGKLPNEDTSAKIIYGYNAETKKYEFDTIYTDNNYKWGFRQYPNLESVDMKWVEDYYPYLIAHIDVTTVITRYPSEAAFYPTHSVTPTYPPTDNREVYSYSYSDSGAGSGSGGCPVGQCWVNGYTRKTGVYVSGYCRRC
jgi:hypothetical protein